MTSSNKQLILRQLPGIDHLLAITEKKPSFKKIPRSVILESARNALANIRKQVLAGEEIKISDEIIIDRMFSLSNDKIKPRLVTVINATGVVLHTNLGRALLCEEALENITTVARSYSNLELNIGTGKRGIRYAAIEELICDLTGAESAIAVNNNAGAVLLALNTIASQTKVIVSWGELV